MRTAEYVETSEDDQDQVLQEAEIDEEYDDELPPPIGEQQLEQYLNIQQAQNERPQDIDE
jgi:hypothetical protein